MAFLKQLFIHLALILVLNPATSHAACVDDLQDLPDITEIKILENTEQGELLMNVTTAGPLIMEPPHPFVTANDGSLYTNITVTLDGEENKDFCDLVEALTTQKISLKCSDDPAGNTKTAVVSIILTDDFAPVLPTAPKVFVPERSAKGTQVLDLTNGSYADPDIDCYTSSIIYDVVNTNSFFKKSDDDKEVILTKELDYELETEHTFELLVRTNVHNSGQYKNATTVVRVMVVDVDDRNPVFNVSKYILEVEEEKNLTDQWLTTTPPIFAFDGDIGINTAIGYSLFSVEPKLDLDIENDTGKVRILSILDRETVDVYEVIVRAYQLDKTYMSATATLSIFVTDINDNRPVFTTTPADVTVQEDAPDGSLVTELTGEDRDMEKNNSDFNFVIRSDDLGAFDVKASDIPGRGWLVVKNTTALRGQTQGIIEIGLVEKNPPDGGPACDYVTTCVGSITVHIDDANLHAPSFENPRYSFSVYSNHDSSQSVGQVKAIDKDKGDNARVTYILEAISQAVDCSKLQINANSGALTLTNLMAPGTDCVYFAKACDNPTDGSLRLCSTAPLTLTVLPGDGSGNNSTGVIEYDVSVLENVPIGTMVAILNLQNVRTNSTNFRIYQDLLLTNSALDREQQDRYTVAILSGTSLDSLSAIYNIHVDDINDNSPEFTKSVYDIIIDDNVETGDVLVQVNATDKDAGQNAMLNYKIESGSDWLAVDSLSGQVILKKLPEQESLNGGEFSVSATDSGSRPLQSLAILKVYAPSHNETAVVLLPADKTSLMNDVPNVESKLSSILGVTVLIHHIENLGDVEALGSKVFVSAKKSDGMELLPSELDSLLKNHADEIHKAFAEEQDSDDDIFTVPFIVLLCVSIFLLLLFIITVAFLCRTRKKYKQNVRIFDKLNRDTTIYDTTRNASNGTTSVNNNDLPNLTSTYSNGSVSALGSSRGSRTATYANVLMGFDNPGYQHDNQNSSRGQENVANGHAHVENLALSQRSSPPDTGNFSSQTPESDQITKFDSAMTENATTNGQPLHMTTIDVKYPPTNRITEGNTPRSERKNSVRSSEANSGVPNEKESTFDHFGDDDEDTEVAQIMTGQEGDGSKPKPETSYTVNDIDNNTNDPEMAGDNSHLDLMRVKPTHPTSTSPPADNGIDVQDGEAFPDEPEPDYAKKVRFNEAPSAKNDAVDSSSKDSHTEFSGDEMVKEVPRYEEEVISPNTDIPNPNASPNEFFLSQAEITAL